MKYILICLMSHAVDLEIYVFTYLLYVWRQGRADEWSVLICVISEQHCSSPVVQSPCRWADNNLSRLFLSNVSWKGHCVYMFFQSVYYAMSPMGDVAEKSLVLNSHTTTKFFFPALLSSVFSHSFHVLQTGWRFLNLIQHRLWFWFLAKHLVLKWSVFLLMNNANGNCYM